MIATGSADWAGSFHEGTGTLTTASGRLDAQPYTFASRFRGADGASPEELLAAAHAGCYNHALANIFFKHGLQVGTIRTTAEVDMGDDAVTPGIAGVRLSVLARVPDVTEEQFQEFAARAGRTCAISKALSVQVRVDAVLDTES